MYDKIEITKQNTIGEKKDMFYYLMLTDFSKKIKTTRWLVKIGDSLYLNEKVIQNNENFEMVYLSCVGNQDCNPNVYILDGKRAWLCGENPGCLKDGETRKGCDSYKSIIQP